MTLADKFHAKFIYNRRLDTLCELIQTFIKKHGCTEILDVGAGDGKLDKMIIVGSTLVCWPQASGDIVVPENITQIEGGAFGGCETLTNVHLPNNIKEIASSTFKGCTHLKSINIPEGVKTIDIEAFAGCKSLTNLDIPDSVTKIGPGAFYGCTGLRNDVAATISQINHDSFENVNELVGNSQHIL